MRSSTLYLTAAMSGVHDSAFMPKMSSKTGFSIRKFISQHKPRALSDDGFPFGSGQEESVVMSSSPRSSFESRLKGTKAGAKAAKDSVKDMHIGHIGPATPHSAKSSLSSIDLNNADLTNPRPAPPRPGSNRPGIGAPLCTSLGSVRSRDALSSSSLDDDEYQLCSSSSPENRPDDIESSAAPAEFEVHWLSPLDLEQESAVPVPVPVPVPVVAPPRVPSRPKDNTVKDFSRETEEAFRLDIPLDETQLSQFCARVEQVQPSKPSATWSTRRSVRASALSTRPHRTKRLTSKKAKRRSKPIVRQANAWTENAKELRDRLNYHIFHRIEVDEVLSLEKLREIRASKAVGTPGTGTSETFTETFSLDDLPSRIGAAGVKFSPPSPVEEVSTIVSNIQGDDDDYVSPSDDNIEIILMQGTDPDTLTLQPQSLSSRLSIMALPSKPTQKAPKPVPQQRLPVIPEVTVTTPNLSVKSPTAPHLKPRPDSIRPKALEQNDDFFFLPSTAYSLNSPGIRHGPIRLAKADLTHLQPSAAMDDTLDWIAFQMAISGGAGDMFGESTDYGQPSYDDLKDLENLAAWFDGFGFQNDGALLTARPTEERVYQPGHTRGSSSPDVIRSRSADSRDVSVRLDRKRQTSRRVPRSNSSDPPRRRAATGESDTMVPPPALPRTSTPKHRHIAESLAVPGQPEPKRHQAGYITGGAVQPPPLPLPLPPSPSPLSLFPRPHHSPNRGGTGTPEARSGVAERKRVAKKDLLAIDAALACGERDRHLTRGRTSRSGSGSGSGNSRPPVVLEQQARPRTSWHSYTSQDSLPQSPMMELVVSKDVDGNEYMVSMGYNLSHDLGDYLQWETNHVFGTGF